MRRVLPLLLLLLLLAGCELRNRQSSEDFLPTGVQSPAPAWSQSPVGTETPEPREWSVVKTILAYDGAIPLSRPIAYYSYQLPMIDLQGAQASGCNQEIESRFGLLIRQSLEAMERKETPVLQYLSYSSYSQAGILTLHIHRVDTDGAISDAYYTMDEKSGEAVSVETLFAAAGCAGDPDELVNQGLLELFTQRFGSPEGAEIQVTTALNRSQEALFPLTVNRMHLTEEGRLVVALELFAPQGGSSLETLSFP